MNKTKASLKRAEKTVVKPTEPGAMLTLADKRRLLAQVVRVNALDFMDETGAFDVARARRELPACCLDGLRVSEVTRTDKQGNTTIKRDIRVSFPDKLKAMEMDSELAELQEAEAATQGAQAQSSELDERRKEAEAKAREVLKEMLRMGVGSQ